MKNIRTDIIKELLADTLSPRLYNNNAQDRNQFFNACKIFIKIFCHPKINSIANALRYPCFFFLES